VAIVIYLVYVYYLTFVIQVSLAAVWTAELVYSFFLGILSYFYIKSGKWQKKKV